MVARQAGPGGPHDPVARRTAQDVEIGKGRPAAIGGAAQETAVHPEEPVLARCLQTANVRGGEGVLGGGGRHQAGVARLVVVPVDAVANAERGVATVVDDDLLGVIRVHQDLHVHPVGAGLQHDVGQQFAVAGILGHHISAGWRSRPHEEGPFCGRGHVGIAGGKNHFGHIEANGKDGWVQRPTGCRHFLFSEAGLDGVLPTSKVGIGVGGHFGRT